MPCNITQKMYNTSNPTCSSSSVNFGFLLFYMTGFTFKIWHPSYLLLPTEYGKHETATSKAKSQFQVPCFVDLSLSSYNTGTMLYEYLQLFPDNILSKGTGDSQVLDAEKDLVAPDSLLPGL